MERERRYDPYAANEGGRMGFGLNMKDLIRYTAAGLGVVMIIVLLRTLLSKIPFAFMRIGVQLLSASGGFKRS